LAPGITTSRYGIVLLDRDFAVKATQELGTTRIIPMTWTPKVLQLFFGEMLDIDFIITSFMSAIYANLSENKFASQSGAHDQ